MQVTRPGIALLIVLLGLIVGTILLTPIGFETRPVSGLKPVGASLLGLVFLAFFLNIAAAALIGSRPRWSALLAAFGPFLFIPPVVADQTGNFSNFTPPHAISIVEIAESVLEVLAGLVALWFWRRGSSEHSATSD